MLRLLVVVALFFNVYSQADLESSLATKTYPIQTYNVTTSDGYILDVRRMPYGKNSSNTNGKVVFLMHGAPYSYNAFIYTGTKNAIAYNLADAGYDVWMGNARGSNYSRRHVTLDPDADTSFFDFTFEQIGLYDLPAMINLALNTTKQNKLHFLGHALGGTAFLALNSMNTTFQSKFASAHLLSANGYETNMTNKNIEPLAEASDVVYSLLKSTGNLEMKTINLTSIFLQNFTSTTVPDALQSGTSVKQIVHLGQNVRDRTFRRWNFGTAGNLQNYNNTSPPAYNLTAINVDVTLYYSLGDTTQSETDVLAMAKAIPNAKVRKISRSTFTNLDYFISSDTKDLVTAYIIQALNNY